MEDITPFYHAQLMKFKELFQINKQEKCVFHLFQEHLTNEDLLSKYFLNHSNSKYFHF